MSNLLVQNIKHTNNTTAMTVDSSGQVNVRGEGSATTTNLQQGLCKAWCDLIHTHDSYNDSFNFSGLTDNGTGDGTGTYSSPFANNDYSVACSMKSGGATNRNALVSSPSTTTVGMITGLTASDSKSDFNSAYTISGDLA